jgi:hypothetical protein
MRHIVSFSGGLGSFMAAERVIQAHGPDDVTLLFTDTLTEDEDLYRFLNDSQTYFGIPVTIIKDGRDIWEVFNDVKYMGNSRVDPCSKHLKRDLAKRWMKDNMPPEESVLYFGIGWDEVNRMKAIEKNWQPYKVSAPLTEPPYLDKSDMINHLQNVGIRPPRLYKMGFPHNNCGGFCVKTGQAQFARLLKEMPKRYAYHEEKQEELFERIGKHGFIRITRNKKLHYLSLKEFREYVEGKGEIDLFDVGGCGCFV